MPSADISHPDISISSDTNGPRPAKKIKITVSNGLEGYLSVKGHNKTRKSAKPKGKLALLPTLPLDILFEIFSHLLPIDILHLSRTTKALRRVLLHRSSTSIWRAALSNVEDLPECPEDLSEPQYANLAFSPHCHNCLTNNIRNVDWRLRVRYCLRCSKTCLVSDENFELPKTVVKCLAGTNWDNIPGDVYDAKAVLDIVEKINSLPTKDAQRQFVREKHTKKKKIIAHAIRCEDWEEDVADDRANQLDELRAARRKAIEEKLTGLGWGEEIAKMPKTHNHQTRHNRLILLDDLSVVRQPKALTDRIWKNIEKEMVVFMKKMKAYRLELEEKESLKKRRSTVSKIYDEYKKARPHLHSEIVPSAADLCSIPEIKAFIDNQSLDIAGFEDRFVGDLDHLIRRWRSTVIVGLVTKLRDERFGNREVLFQESEAKLSLAISVFVCSEGDYIHYSRLRDWDGPWPERKKRYEAIWYPQILHHRCTTLETIPWYEREEEPDLSTKLGDGFASAFKRKPWSSEKLIFDEKASRVVWKILMACGLNPYQTTAVQLDDLDPRIVCLKCTHGHTCDGERRVQVRTWRKTVAHCMMIHWGDPTVEYEKIADDNVAKARAEEQLYAEKNPKTTPAEPMWTCILCHDTPQETNRLSKSKVDQHLSKHHSIATGLEGRDYRHALDATHEEPPAIYMVPRATKDAPRS
ncbi:hypothetical protein JAAARDRAFT_202398 [Jaapia argillacea MUCL 33604]|uniref:F-box domain-containing protein n=1 Tax=Jaapia argillacea MUCL 33604 TaxID=933084 RepID=A0A067QJQ8_9AGAM|nr:hypothetical protein JAAARDRAFT_202398 [Jaapia argillacea MUCL 33604]